mmetsp:Transcript_27162/g.63167  ORF Transcript_27162/g.63167 Transcript_27162/m.63167 type:complete len:1372 (-) Transcript_27162:103-4218(-)
MVPGIRPENDGAGRESLCKVVLLHNLGVHKSRPSTAGRCRASGTAVVSSNLGSRRPGSAASGRPRPRSALFNAVGPRRQFSNLALSDGTDDFRGAISDPRSHPEGDAKPRPHTADRQRQLPRQPEWARVYSAHFYERPASAPAKSRAVPVVRPPSPSGAVMMGEKERAQYMPLPSLRRSSSAGAMRSQSHPVTPSGGNIPPASSSHADGGPQAPPASPSGSALPLATQGYTGHSWVQWAPALSGNRPTAEESSSSALRFSKSAAAHTGPWSKAAGWLMSAEPPRDRRSSEVAEEPPICSVSPSSQLAVVVQATRIEEAQVPDLPASLSRPPARSAPQACLGRRAGRPPAAVDPALPNSRSNSPAASSSAPAPRQRSPSQKNSDGAVPAAKRGLSPPNAAGATRGPGHGAAVAAAAQPKLRSNLKRTGSKRAVRRGTSNVESTAQLVRVLRWELPVRTKSSLFDSPDRSSSGLASSRAPTRDWSPYATTVAGTPASLPPTEDQEDEGAPQPDVLSWQPCISTSTRELLDFAEALLEEARMHLSDPAAAEQVQDEAADWMQDEYEDAFSGTAGTTDEDESDSEDPDELLRSGSKMTVRSEASMRPTMSMKSVRSISEKGFAAAGELQGDSSTPCQADPLRRSRRVAVQNFHDRDSASAVAMQAAQEVHLDRPMTGIDRHRARAAFDRMATNGEVMRKDLVWILKLTDHDTPEAIQWVNQIMEEQFGGIYILDRPAFDLFLTAYEQKSIMHMRELFRQTSGGAWVNTVSLKELSMLLRKFGVTPLPGEIEALLQEARGFDTERSKTVVTFEDFTGVADIIRNREGFTYDESKRLKAVFARFAAEGVGRVRLAAMPHVLLWMHIRIENYLVERFFEEADLDMAEALDERQFFALMRRIKEHDISMVFAKFGEKAKPTNGVLNVTDLPSCLHSLGYLWPLPELLEEIQTPCHLKGKTTLMFEEGYLLLDLYRLSNGFLEAEKEDVWEAFALMDADGDGALDIVETSACLRWLGYKTSIAVLRELCRKVEVRDQDRVDCEEILRLAQQCHSREQSAVADLFAEYNLDASGKLPLIHFRPLLAALGHSLAGARAAVIEKEAEKTYGGERTFAGELKPAQISFWKYLDLVRKYRLTSRTEYRANRLFSEQEVVRIRATFRGLVVKDSQTIVKEKLTVLLSLVFPVFWKLAAQTQDGQRLLETAQEVSTFEDCLEVLRLAQDLVDRQKLKKEQQAISFGKFSQSEVEEFRQIFIHACDDGPLSAPTTSGLLGRAWSLQMPFRRMLETLHRVLDFDEGGAQELIYLMISVDSNVDAALDFAEFMRVFRKLQSKNWQGINEKVAIIAEHERRMEARRQTLSTKGTISRPVTMAELPAQREEL